MKIVDTNILLYSVNEDAAHHEASRRWLEAALAGDETIGIDWITIVGFLHISTRPGILAKPLTATQACDQIQEWLDVPIVHIVESTTRHWLVFKELVAAVGTLGNLTNDAHLAALAISHDATLVSCDTDFARFPGLEWQNPLAAS